jgi:hypothetical protein
MKTKINKKYIENNLGQKLVGKTFAPVKNIGTRDYGKGGKTTHYMILCDCGKTKELPLDAVRDYKSCGNDCPLQKKFDINSCNDAGRKIQEDRAKLINNIQYNFYLKYGEFNRYKREANKRKLEFSIEPSDIERLWIKQNGRCNQTGVKLICQPHDRGTWSLDRISNYKGYTKDNIQIVSKIYNMVKMVRTDEEIKLFSYLVFQNLTAEETRKYNSMTIEQINETLRLCTKTKRRVK